MRSKVALQDNAPDQLSDKCIYIIGPRRLQNELMASFLERETGAKCIKGENVSHILAIKDTNQSKLILWDCMEKDPNSFLGEIESDGKKMFSRDSLALFNVVPYLGIEEKALKKGVRGFFYEQDPLDLFPKGVRAIFNGELWASREIMTEYILKNREKESTSKKEAKILTPREIEILTLIATGAKNEEIANELYISQNTVKTHVYNIFKKIKVPNRLQAALWVAKNL